MKIAGYSADGPAGTGNLRAVDVQGPDCMQMHSQDLFPFEAGAIGIVRTSERYGEIPMIYHAAGGGFVAVAGVPDEEWQVAENLARVVEVSVGEALNELAALDGAYAALYWNPHEKKLGLVTDFMGFQPVYICGSPMAAIASRSRLLPPRLVPQRLTRRDGARSLFSGTHWGPRPNWPVSSACGA